MPFKKKKSDLLREPQYDLPTSSGRCVFHCAFHVLVFSTSFRPLCFSLAPWNACEFEQKHKSERTYLHLLLQVDELVVELVKRVGWLSTVAAILGSDLLFLKHISGEAQNSQHIIALAHILQQKVRVRGESALISTQKTLLSSKAT